MSSSTPTQTPAARRGLLLAAAAILLVGVAAGLAVIFGLGRDTAVGPSSTPSPTSSPTRSPTPSASPSASPSPTPSPTPVSRCRFDGDELAGPINHEPALISIDNHPDARPGTGLQQADIVFENPVQGNSTRFVALFACDTVQTVGPVRSGRWVQTDLWQQLHVLPIIFGAAPYTERYFAAAGMPYVDGNWEGWPFFSRSATRPSPYNVYLDLPRLRELLASNADLAARVDRAGEPRALFAFNAEWVPPEGARGVTVIDIATASYWSFGWRYVAETGVYERVDAGSVTADAGTGEPLTKRTIIVQRAVSERTFADARPDADPPIQRLVGTGTGTVYVRGVAIDVEWSRPTAGDATEWTVAATGEPLLLPPGPIWWEIIQTTASLVES